MTRHNWLIVGEGIELCLRCKMYKCTAKSDPEPGPGRNRKTNVEYSTFDGEVIALNPADIPACTGGSYDS